MTAIDMPPMPDHFRAAQITYAKLIDEVRLLVSGTGVTPQLALTLALIGDRTVSPTDLRRHGYVAGTNTTHYVGELKRGGLIETVGAIDRRCRPIKLTPEGRRIAIRIREKLLKMRDAELARTSPHD